MNDPRIRQLDAVAARSWPAAEAVPLGGWLLRATQGVTRRANSVSPGEEDDLPLFDKIRLVEQFYAERGLPARYQISPASLPAHLDETLTERGYRTDGNAFVQVAPLERVRRLLPSSSGHEVKLSSSLEEEWLLAWCASEGAGEHERQARAGIVGRIQGGVQPAFASASRAGEVVGVGLGVREGDWLGVFLMATVPAFRRQGVASAVLAALTRWAAEQGAGQAYLQVMTTNAAAQNLYARLGFETVYEYYYRTRVL